MSGPRVLCAGLVTVDVLYFLESHPTEGAKHRADGAKMIAGGGALNAAAAIAAMGGHAILAGTVGDDLFGRFIRQEVARLGIDDALLVTLPEIDSAHSAILINTAGERSIVNHRDDRLFTDPTQTDLCYDAVLLDTRWRAAMADLLPAARALGKPAVIDAEAPLALVADLLPLASHVAFSEQGLADFTVGSDADGLTSAAQRLQTWVCVTRGPRSVLYHDGMQLGESPVEAVQSNNTLGAGDVWHGVFAFSLAKGLPESEAVQRANSAAKQGVQRAGVNSIQEAR